MATKNPSKQASVFGYLHRTTTELTRALGLELPLGHSTSPADVHAGTAFIAPRPARAMPVLPGHVHLGDAASDVTAHSHWVHDRGGRAVFAYNPRPEHLDPESLVHRGYDQ